MDNTNNLLFTIDSYKALHPQMLPEGTRNVYSYLESRKGAKYPYTLFFGLQYILRRWLSQPITTSMVDEAETLFNEHFKFNGKVWDRSRWDYIINMYDGRLPLRIKAVPEGTRVPVGNVLMDVESTDGNCGWLVGAMETLLQQVWYPSTVATRSHSIAQLIRQYFAETVDDNKQWLADYYLHDFGARGATNMDAAGIGGAAHLVNFKSTDTVMAMAYAQRYYDAPLADLAYSVPASEHSIATSLGPTGEFDVAKRLMRLFPKGILSHVSDSYDIEKAVQYYNTDPEFRKMILARNGKFVARPDSPRFSGDTAANQVLWITKQWEQGFGSSVNSKGYRDLHPNVGSIYGDGLSPADIEECLSVLRGAGFSALACVYGMGGGLLQRGVDRDTMRQAFKCSAQQHYDTWVDIYKAPKDSTKKSKKGRLKLIRKDGALLTVSHNEEGNNELTEVFCNGEITRIDTFSEIRKRAKQN